MERYAVSWSDVGADPNDGFDGFSTARFATLREAIPCAVRHGGIICNMKERPYAPENGHPLAFAPGDRVTFVNDYGVRFPGHVVVRIMQRDEDEWLYCAGRRYFIDSDSPWFPVCEENLLPE